MGSFSVVDEFAETHGSHGSYPYLLVMKLNGNEYTFVHANEGVLGGAPHIDPHSITLYNFLQPTLW